jgi:hypothetical protein
MTEARARRPDEAAPRSTGRGSNGPARIDEGEV